MSALSSTGVAKVQEKPSSRPKAGAGEPRRPAAPTSLTVTTAVEIPEITQIIDLLKKLNDSHLLNESRDYSNFYNFSIARWANRRSSLVYGNIFAHVCAPKTEIDVPQPGRAADAFVPTMYNDVLLECLTIRDVEELAQYEGPIVTDPNQIGGRVTAEIQTSVGSLPRDLFWASVFTQALLFFVLVYFSAFAREATSSPTFPLPGTLFGAFSRSRPTLFVLLLALWIPVVASVSVAIVSQQLCLAVCSGIIVSAVASVHLVLRQKSYFGALKLRSGWRSKASCS